MSDTPKLTDAVEGDSVHRLVVPLPCPFCGCEIVRVLECIRISVACDLCRAHGPAAKTEADAVEQWNRHANSKRDLVEALRKAVAWGEAASNHILYREKINWRYLEEARGTLDSYSRHNVDVDASPPLTPQDNAQR